jgi:hypothetical protein
VAVLGLSAVAYGIALTAGLDAARDAWPWPLPPLPAEIIGTWQVAFGVLALAAVLPRDRSVWAGPAAAALVTLTLIAVTVVRFSSFLD